MGLDAHKTIYAATPHEWREWLRTHHATEKGVWLVLYKKNSGMPTLSWSEAVDGALCFGWIDSIKRKYDDRCSVQFFSKRKPTSGWSKINKEKVGRLMEQGLMAPAGLECVRIAKKNRSWTRFDAVEALKVPADLRMAMRQHKPAKAYFDSLSRSKRKALLMGLAMAKRPETRARRIDEFIRLAVQYTNPPD